MLLDHILYVHGVQGPAVLDSLIIDHLLANNRSPLEIYTPWASSIYHMTTEFYDCFSYTCEISDCMHSAASATHC